MTRDPYEEDTCDHCAEPIEQPTQGRPRKFCSDVCRQRYRREYDYHGWRDPQHYGKVHRRAARELKRIEKRTGPIDDTPHPEWGISMRYRVVFRLQRNMPIPECVVCGKPYIVDAPGPYPEFCSAECHQEYAANERAVHQGLIDHAGNYDPRVDVRIRLGLPIRACAQCGKPFPIYNPRKRFCSHACRNAHWHARHPRCPRCGKRFSREGKRSDAIYCSRRCMHQTSRARWSGGSLKALDRSARPCEECGEVFTPHPRSSVPQKYCGKRCRSRAKDRMRAERKRKEKAA